MRWFLLFLFVLAACRARPAESSALYEPSYGVEADFDDAPAMERASAPARQASGFGRAGPPSPAPSSRPAPRMEEGVIATGSEPDRAAPTRMIHYNGFARVRVTRVDELLDQVAAMAERIGGRVELLRGRQISVRVPADRFEDAFANVLSLGDVLSRSVRADDVTEQFTAVDLRVQTLRATRDRLVDLLAKATEEHEKLRLLTEITRVTEELDAFERQLRTLADLAGFARITVEGVPREVLSGARGPDQQGFDWIRALSPFRRAIFEDDTRLALDAPDGLVALSKRGPFLAESPDGVVLWTLRLPNDPVGDGAFWIAAIEDRIGGDFAAVRRAEAGLFTCLVLDEPGTDDPYQWRVCVQQVGRRLHVAQAWFPSPGAVARYEAGVMTSIAGGAR